MSEERQTFFAPFAQSFASFALNLSYLRLGPKPPTRGPAGREASDNFFATSSGSFSSNPSRYVFSCSLVRGPVITLVIPRRHVADLWQVDPSLGAELMTGVIRVGRAIDQALNQQTNEVEVTPSDD